MQLEAVSAGNRIATRRLVKQRQLKSQYKRKRRVEIVCVSMLSKTEKRQRKRESRLRASEAQRDKGRQRSRARDKKKKWRNFFLEEQHQNFVAAVTRWEMLAATNKMQGENERQWKKVKESTYDIFSIKIASFWTFHFAVVQNNSKEMYKKSMLHVQSCILANLGYVFLGKSKCRIPNPKTDFAFFWANPKTDHESIKSTLWVDSSDQIQIWIFEIHNLSFIWGKGFEKSNFVFETWYTPDAVHVWLNWTYICCWLWAISYTSLDVCYYIYIRRLFWNPYLSFSLHVCSGCVCLRRFIFQVIKKN